MNEELQKQLAALIASLMNVAQDAGQFASEQIPPLVAEKIAFGRVYETAIFVALIAAAGICALAVRWSTKHWDEYEEMALVLGIFAGIGGLVGIGCAVDQFRVVALVWFAPRLYIVEWLRGLV